MYHTVLTEQIQTYITVPYVGFSLSALEKVAAWNLEPEEVSDGG